jgi:uncharacterized protein (TIGR02246 family)
MSDPTPSPSRSWFVAFGPLLLIAGICVGLMWSLRLMADAHRAGAASAVRAVLQEQADAWNAGELERFMDTYAEDLVFYTGGNVLEGRESLAERYRKRYQKDGKEKMGRLTFSDLEVIALDGDHALARGRWKVVMQKDTPEGLFTLLMRRTPGGWKIAHDHTSAADPPKSP